MRLPEALVEFVGELRLLIDAVGNALLAAGAEVLVDVARPALDAHGVIADVAVHLGDFRVAPERDVRVRAHLGHLGRQNAGGAIQRRERLVELGHVAADGRLALDEVNFLARVGQGQRGVNAGNAAAHHQHVGMDGDLLDFQGSMPRHARDGGARQGLGLLGGLGAVGMHPGIMLADVDHVEEEGVQTSGLDRAPERMLVQQRGAGGHHHAVEPELLDVLLDHLLARVGAHVLVVARQGDAGELLDILGDLGAVHHRAMLCPQWQM